ncbi:hypothetical protein EV383_6004 [Pseudonocardia sediminis]|uniref:DUF4913 domain-containing protein n=1 Tax=Pseudonocardia sediminis TaxID=1397368 RepID=A0A4Q7V8C1_PSEST|nr:hypothetical protein [Pseudonocardia sediminis]RZT89049.1 hypothetical protein EV383_6004 [Pseudonocardia sediminis]
MRTPAHPEPAGSEPVDSAVYSGLAREVSELKRRLDALDPVEGRVDELGRLVSQMADTLATLAARRRPAAAPSWLLAPTDPEKVRALVEELCAWLGAVFMRYPDGAQVLPDCWLFHADVVEELLWLMYAWCAAYQGGEASVSAAGDWNERHRPGVVARLRRSVGSCSIEAHQTRPGWGAPACAPVPVPGLDHATAITGWWATARDQTPPEPAQTERAPIGGALG